MHPLERHPRNSSNTTENRHSWMNALCFSSNQAPPRPRAWEPARNPPTVEKREDLPGDHTARFITTSHAVASTEIVSLCCRIVVILWGLRGSTLDAMGRKAGVIALFDVDGTLTLPRKVRRYISPISANSFRKFVGGFSRIGSGGKTMCVSLFFSPI
jgi:hypothetical protein